MVSAYLDENDVPLPRKLEDLHAWFPAESPEPHVEVSQTDALGEHCLSTPFMSS